MIGLSSPPVPGVAALHPVLAAFWIAQADVVYAVVSTTLLLAVVVLVLRPGNR